MAALQNIRNHAVILIVFIAVALLAFVIEGFLTSTSTIVYSDRDKVGIVDGKSITQPDFQQNITSLTEVLRQQTQMSNRPMPSDADIQFEVWNRFVNGTLLENEMEETGLAVTEDEVIEITRNGSHPMLRQVPFFYNQNGQFDKNVVTQVFALIDKPTEDLESNEIDAYNYYKNAWSYWDTQIRRQMGQDKLMSLIVNAVSAPNRIAELMNKIQSEEKDVLVVKKSFSEQEFNGEISEADIRAEYEKVKNEKYKTEGFRSIKVVLFEINPSEKDYYDTKAAAEEIRENMKNANEEELKVLFSESSQRYPYAPVYCSVNNIDRAFEEFAFGAAKDSVSSIQFSGNHFVMAKQLDAVKTAPDSANISIIVIADNDKDALQKKNDSLMALLKGGAKFEDVANENSLDRNTAAKGGEAGWIQEGSQFAVTDFDNKVFSAKKGDILSFDTDGNPMKFIVKVNDLTKPVKKAKIAVLGKELDASSETGDICYQEAKKFATLYNTRALFESAADSMNKQVRPYSGLGKNQPEIYMLPNSREIIKWAWNPDTKIDEVNMFSANDMYIVATLCDAVSEDEEYIPLSNEAVRTEVELLAKNSACAKLIVEDLKNAGYENADTLKAIKYANNYISLVGTEPAAVGAIMATPAGVETKPIVGNTGVFKFKVISSNPSPANITVDMLNYRVGSQVFSEMFNSLKENAEIQDNRYNFY